MCPIKKKTSIRILYPHPNNAYSNIEIYAWKYPFSFLLQFSFVVSKRPERLEIQQNTEVRKKHKNTPGYCYAISGVPKWKRNTNCVRHRGDCDANWWKK